MLTRLSLHCWIHATASAPTGWGLGFCSGWDILPLTKAKYCHCFIWIHQICVPNPQDCLLFPCWNIPAFHYCAKLETEMANPSVLIEYFWSIVKRQDRICIGMRGKKRQKSCVHPHYQKLAKKRSSFLDCFQHFWQGRAGAAFLLINKALCFWNVNCLDQTSLSSQECRCPAFNSLHMAKALATEILHMRRGSFGRRSQTPCAHALLGSANSRQAGLWELHLQRNADCFHWGRKTGWAYLSLPQETVLFILLWPLLTAAKLQLTTYLLLMLCPLKERSWKAFEMLISAREGKQISECNQQCGGLLFPLTGKISHSCQRVSHSGTNHPK